MIQAILIFLLLLFLAQLLMQPLASWLQRMIGFVVIAAGVVFVMWPDLTNTLAHLLGVGRGADLLTYLAVCTGSLVLYRFYLRLRLLEIRDVEMVRELAILRYSASAGAMVPPSTQATAPASPGTASRAQVEPAPEPEPPPDSSERRLNAVSGTLAVLLCALLLRKGWQDLDLAWDALAYHLPFAALRAGLISPDSYRLSAWMGAVYHGFPVMVEFLQGWAWRLTGHIQAANFIGFAGLLGFAAAMWRWFRISMADVLLCSLAIPVILIGSTSMYDDLWVNCAAATLLLLTFGALIRPEEFSPARLLAALIAFAVALNSKLQFTGVGTLALGGLLLVLWIRRSRLTALGSAWGRAKPAARAAFLGGCGLVIACGYVNSVQNWFAFGNPVYPVQVKLGPLNWPGNFHVADDEPAYLIGTPQPERWLLSVLEVNAFDGRNPLWTNSQGDVSLKSRALRMGGFFAVYVVLSLFWWSYLQRRARPRFGYAPAVFFACVTVVTACLPASHELRYYSYWMLTLVAMNLVLIESLGRARAHQIRRAVLATAGACLFFAVSSSNGRYLSLQGSTPAGIVGSIQASRHLADMNLAPGEAVCVFGKNPYAFFYAPLFHPELAGRLHYRAVEGYTEQDCAGIRKVP